MKVRIELTSKPLVVKHQSISHDAIRQGATTNTKRMSQIDEAVAYCKENSCRGKKALNSGLFPSIGCHKTINRRLDGEITTGREKQHCSL